MRDEVLLKPDEVARLCGVGSRTIRRWRTEGRGPKFRVLTPRVFRYDRSDVDEWLRRQAATDGNSTAVALAAGHAGE